MKKHFFFSFLCFLLISSYVTAQDGSDMPFSMNGYGRASVYGGGDKYALSSVFSELSLQTSVTGSHSFLEADIRFRTGMFFNQNETTIQIKELYAGYKSQAFDVLLGNQIVTWGRTEGFSPTNNITPNDYFFLSSDPNDQRLSNFMLKMNYRPAIGIGLELIAIPFYKMSRYRFDLFDMGFETDGLVLGGFDQIDIGNLIDFGNDMVPEKILANGSYAARADFDFSVLGGSVSWFRGYDPYHGFDVVSVNWSTGQPVIRIASMPYLKTTIGADLDIPIGSLLIVKAEAAYNHTVNPKNYIYIPKPDISYVVGLETNLLGFMILGQYIGKYTFGFSPLAKPPVPSSGNVAELFQFAEDMIDYETRLFNRKVFNQQEKTNHALFLMVTRMFAYDVITAECTGYYNLTSGEWFVRPKVSWRISDTFAVSAGGNYMKGKNKTLYGFSGPVMNGVFTEFRVIF
ncbi:MAG: hypothetical protein WBK97_05025 [Bacteroidales bacterium]|jgi:hypothetical protein